MKVIEWLEMRPKLSIPLLVVTAFLVYSTLLLQIIDLF